MSRRIRFIKGVLYQKVAQAYEVDKLDIDWNIKHTLNFKSLKDLDSEGLDEVINMLDQMLLQKGIDINDNYHEAIKR